jgi:hypothetical protein
MSVPIRLLLPDHGLRDGIPYWQKVLVIPLLRLDVSYGVIAVFG